MNMNDVPGIRRSPLAAVPCRTLAAAIFFGACAGATPCQASLTAWFWMSTATPGQSLFDTPDSVSPESETDDAVFDAPEFGSPTSVGSGGGVLDDLLDDGADLGEIKSEMHCDRIFQSIDDRTRWINVALLAQPLGKPNPVTEYEFIDIGSKGTSKSKVRIWGRELRIVSYYEERMLDRAAEELPFGKVELLRPGASFDLSHPDLAKRALRARWLLNEALSHHDSARQAYRRRGNAWDAQRDQLTRALLNLNLGLVQRQISQGELARALAACDQLLATNRRDGRLMKYFERLMLAPAERAFQADDFATARAGLEEFLRRFPGGSAAAEKLRNNMIAVARTLVARAQSEKDARILDQAAAVWPQLAELDAVRRTMITSYPVLHCSFPDLPGRFSPLSAQTPTERQITTLLFDRLIRWHQDQRHYDPRLAATRPRPLARGREFRLPQVVWSDSDTEPNYVTSADVRATVHLLQSHPTYHYPTAWSRRIQNVLFNVDDDPFRVAIQLDVDHWQPLAFMDFPVLPRSSFPVLNDEKQLQQAMDRFARNPVGTGPFQLHPDGPERERVRLVANPHYRKVGLPHIREVHLYQMDSATALREFAAGRLHMIYDVRPEHVDQMRGRSIEKLPDRTVHFLAPNHENRSLQNENLRLAIAHAVPREDIVAGIFRPSRQFRSDHATLNGPYPTRSWAYSPTVEDFALQHAANYLNIARTELAGLPSLKLIYPNDNPDIGRACEEIRKTLQSPKLGLTLELEAVAAEDYFDRVVNRRRFDLAYWRHDFDNETYWIWPLLDPQEIRAGGANFMGYEPDNQLLGLFQRVNEQKRFRSIRAATHATHKYIARRAIIIPLWELDVYIAISESVQGMRENLDSGNVFENVENWTIKSR